MTGETQASARGALVCRGGYTVRGRVQGVGFRWWTRRAAERLSVAGTVRNCADGSVQVMVNGPCDAVDEFVATITRGPPLARVDSVEEVPYVLDEDVHTFEIKE